MLLSRPRTQQTKPLFQPHLIGVKKGGLYSDYTTNDHLTWQYNGARFFIIGWPWWTKVKQGTMANIRLNHIVKLFSREKEKTFLLSVSTDAAESEQLIRPTSTFRVHFQIDSYADGVDVDVIRSRKKSLLFFLIFNPLCHDSELFFAKVSFKLCAGPGIK